MSELKILRLELRNFKGQHNLALDFGGRSGTIYGDNATGKTTVYDAFSWLLFGVDSLGQAAFDVKPLGADGQVVDHSAVTFVEANLLVGDEHHTLRRTYYEKWSRKRGSINETYDGNTCDYFLDDVPVKKKLYDETVQNMVGSEQTFRVLTDLRRFCVGLPWKERRKLLMDMCWNTTDQAVMEQDKRFLPLLEAMGGRTLDDYRAMLAAKRKNLSGTRDKIPTRLDELNRMLESTQVCDYDAVREEITQLNEQLRVIQLAADQDSRSAQREQLSQKRRALEEQRHILEQSNRSYRAGIPRPDLARLSGDVNALTERCQSAAASKNFSDREIENLEAELKELRGQWSSCKAQKFTGGTCPTCGQALPPDQLQQAQSDFQDRQARELAAIEKRALRKKEQILTEEKRVKELAKSLEDDRSRLKQAEEALSEAKPQATQPVPDLPEYAAQKAELDQRIRDCSDRIAALQREMAGQDAGDKAAQIKAEIRQRESLLANERTIQNTKQRMAELKEEKKKSAAALEELDNLLYLCDEFTRYKVQLIDDTVSGCFRLVRFKLSHEQVNGGLSECCEAMVNGVPYASLNNGSQVNAGIDIVRTLSDYYDVKVPLFIDNSESVTELMDAGTQVICLAVSEQDKELRLVS